MTDLANYERTLLAKRRLVVRICTLVAVAMVLYPPKNVRVAMTNHDIGYGPLWENSLSVPLFGNMSVEINFIKLAIQVLIVAVFGFLLIRYYQEQSVETSAKAPVGI